MTGDSARQKPTRRQFIAASAAALAAPAIAGQAVAAAQRQSPDGSFQLRPGWAPTGFDPWIEIIADAFRHNVRETSRLAGGTPILAVIKNNAYGLGDQVIGPIVASCGEVAALACTRVSEALAMRAAGVRKPILDMAETSEEELAELARHNVWPSMWLDDAHARLERVSRKLKRPIPVHLYLDMGMGREGMPDYRAKDWVESLCRSKAVKVDGTYMMFAHDYDFGPKQLARFARFTADAKAAGLSLGRLHASPTFEVLYLPEARLDMVRPGNLIFGNFSRRPELREEPDVRPVFRLCARIARLEQLRPGDSASFRREYTAERPTWIALLPVGHTDGYPQAAAKNCQVLIRGRLYPVVAVVSSSHTIIEIGDEKTVEIGDTATLIGPDDPAITPHAVAAKTGISFLALITKMSAMLPRKTVLKNGDRLPCPHFSSLLFTFSLTNGDTVACPRFWRRYARGVRDEKRRTRGPGDPRDRFA